MHKFWSAIDLCANVLDELSPPVLRRLESALERKLLGSSEVIDTMDDQATLSRIAEYLFPIAEIDIQSIAHDKEPSGQEDLVSLGFYGNDLDIDESHFNILDFDDMLPFITDPENIDTTMSFGY